MNHLFGAVLLAGIIAVAFVTIVATRDKLDAEYAEALKFKTSCKEGFIGLRIEGDRYCVAAYTWPGHKPEQ